MRAREAGTREREGGMDESGTGSCADWKMTVFLFGSLMVSVVLRGPTRIEGIE